MATSTLKILREINNYSQEYIAEDILKISPSTYSRLEQNSSKITGEQAQKLAELYNVNIANLLSEATPIITFQTKSISDNTNNGNNGYSNNSTNHFHEGEVNALKDQIELLKQQNTNLLGLVKILGGKLAGTS